MHLIRPRTPREQLLLSWELIRLLGLNDKENPRFQLVDTLGKPCSVDRAFGLYDCITQDHYEALTTPVWMNSFMRRFLIGCGYNQATKVGEATVAGCTGYGETPGVAVLEVLVSALRQGRLKDSKEKPPSELGG